MQGRAEIRRVPEDGGEGSVAAAVSAAQRARAVVGFLLRRWWLVVLVAMVLGASYGRRSVSNDQVYDAYAYLDVPAIAEGEFVGSDLEMNEGVSAVETIKSDHLMAKVAEDLDLAHDARFMGSAAAKNLSAAEETLNKRYAAGMLRGRIRINFVANTTLVRLDFYSHDPELAAAIVNKLADDYMEDNTQRGAPAAEEAAQVLAGNLQELKQQSMSLQARLLDMQKQLHTPDFDPRQNQIAEALTDLTRRRLRARRAREVAQENAERLARASAGGDAEAFDALPDVDASLALLRRELTAAQTEEARLAADLGPNHPEVKASRTQVRALLGEFERRRRALLAKAREEVRLAADYEAQISGRLKRQTADAAVLGPTIVQYINEQRQFFEIRELYFELQARIAAARVDAGYGRIEAIVAAHAEVPAAPLPTTFWYPIVRYGFFAGLLSFVALALLKALETARELSASDVEGLTGLPVLTVVPTAGHANPRAILAALAGAGSDAPRTAQEALFLESFLTLRTALQLTVADQPVKFLLFTSATPAEGKTTVTSSIAATLAQRGGRVLLIDADMRKPKVHQRFGLSGKVGLSTVLSGARSFSDCVQTVEGVPGLHILASGPVPPLPSELLSSAGMNALLEDVAGAYTHVLIDSPPVLAVTDAIVLSQRVDGVVWVIRNRRATRQTLKKTQALLRSSGVRMAGVVLNAADVAVPASAGERAWFRRVRPSV